MPPQQVAGHILHPPHFSTSSFPTSGCQAPSLKMHPGWNGHRVGAPNPESSDILGLQLPDILANAGCVTLQAFCKAMLPFFSYSTGAVGMLLA